jgi:hypothetical protein
MALQRCIAMSLLCLLLAAAGCNDDHRNGLQEVMADDCATCHLGEAARVTRPIHLGNLPQTCFECHVTTAWSPSFFSHATAISACYDCHRVDYEISESPPHIAEMFPRTCDDCHRTEAWRPALDGLHPEDRFRLSAGAHRPFACQSCHDLDRGSSRGGLNTDCVGCHTGAHSRARMDDKHSGEPDYSFDEDHPNFCLACHPDGR